jgi:hypothetical protein
MIKKLKIEKSMENKSIQGNRPNQQDEIAITSDINSMKVKEKYLNLGSSENISYAEEKKVIEKTNLKSNYLSEFTNL